MDDPYVYPGTKILINRMGIRSQRKLERRERTLTALSLLKGIPPLVLAPSGLSAIHKHVFQDVYPWAGEIRECELAKSGSMFCRAQFLEANLKERLTAMRKDRGLLSQEKEVFAERAAEHICELNALHPFREGNGRVMRLLLSQLADRAGLNLDMEKISQSRWMEASIESFNTRNYGKMKELLVDVLDISRTRLKQKDRGRSRSL